MPPKKKSGTSKGFGKIVAPKAKSGVASKGGSSAKKTTKPVGKSPPPPPPAEPVAPPDKPEPMPEPEPQPEPEPTNPFLGQTGLVRVQYSHYNKEFKIEDGVMQFAEVCCENPSPTPTPTPARLKPSCPR